MSPRRNQTQNPIQCSFPPLGETFRSFPPRCSFRRSCVRVYVEPFWHVCPSASACVSRVPEKYRVDPHGRLRDFYEDFMQRPPTDDEIRWADSHHRGWQDGGHVWQNLLCGLCTQREFLAQWDSGTMATCGECGAPLSEALAPFVAEAQVCSTAGVDIVYTYAADSDPAWADERARWWTSLGFFDKSR